eukprot:GHRQ01022002.1.p4 GENE.GHRQ01022002.1~~GHRQ01022002.1.p4  ORF type:complete len:117 (+),score=8.78 GHRQ01022002.1:111-461(+)
MKRVITRSSWIGALLLAPALLAELAVSSDTNAFITRLPGSIGRRLLHTTSLALCTRLLCLRAALLNVVQLLVAVPWLPVRSARRDIVEAELMHLRLFVCRYGVWIQPRRVPTDGTV